MSERALKKICGRTKWLKERYLNGGVWWGWRECDKEFPKVAKL